MALETPAAPAPCLCAYVELEAQVAMARSAWESNGTSQTGDLPLAGRAALAREQEQLWQESSNFQTTKITNRVSSLSLRMQLS